MKLVREHINEKFVKDSDPVRDLGIGGINTGRIKTRLKKEYEKKFKKTFKDLLEGKTITGRFNEILIKQSDQSGGFQLQNGRGWGEYTIYVKEIIDEHFNVDSAAIMVYDGEGAAYMIPFEDKKIFYETG